jgi:hypothetical protein
MSSGDVLLRYEVMAPSAGEDFLGNLGWLHVHATTTTPTGSTIHLVTVSRKFPWEKLVRREYGVELDELEAMAGQVGRQALDAIVAARSDPAV